MILLAADTKRDQEMIDKFQRAYENLKKIVDKQNEKIKDLESGMPVMYIGALMILEQLQRNLMTVALRYVEYRLALCQECP